MNINAETLLKVLEMRQVLDDIIKEADAIDPSLIAILQQHSASAAAAAATSSTNAPVASGISNTVVPDKAPRRSSGRKGISPHPFHGKSTKARPIRMLNPETQAVIAEYDSIAQAARDNDVSASSIWASCNIGRPRRGYLWKYLDVPEEKSNG